MKNDKSLVDAVLNRIFEDEYKKEFFKKRWTGLGLRLLIGGMVLFVCWLLSRF